MDPSAYRALLARLVEEGRTTGPDQSAEMVAYTKLNLARTVRMERTVVLSAETKSALEGAPAMTWLVITEPWCGDSSQVVPVLQRMAAHAPRIRLCFLLRDEHPELMDRYLTNGARAIPKLIAVDEGGNERFTWGPRPKAAQDLVIGNKQLPLDEQLPKAELYAKVHAWYAKDRGRTVQAEVAEALGKR